MPRDFMGPKRFISKVPRRQHEPPPRRRSARAARAKAPGRPRFASPRRRADQRPASGSKGRSRQPRPAGRVGESPTPARRAGGGRARTADGMAAWWPGFHGSRCVRGHSGARSIHAPQPRAMRRRSGGSWQAVRRGRPRANPGPSSRGVRRSPARAPGVDRRGGRGAGGPGLLDSASGSWDDQRGADHVCPRGPRRLEPRPARRRGRESR